MAISKFNYNSFNVTPVAGNALSFNSDADVSEVSLFTP